MMIVRIECRADQQRADIQILRDDVLCGHLECDLDRAFEMLTNAHNILRVQGHPLRIEIVNRPPVA
jgi:hypothetical protein